MSSMCSNDSRTLVLRLLGKFCDPSKLKREKPLKKSSLLYFSTNAGHTSWGDFAVVEGSDDDDDDDDEEEDDAVIYR